MPKYDALIAAIRHYTATTTIPGMAHIMGNMAQFLAALAEDAERQTAENLALQRQLLRLTRILAWLTAALFVFTAFLCFDAYQKTRRDADTQKPAAEQRAPNDNVPVPKT